MDLARHLVERIHWKRNLIGLDGKDPLTWAIVCLQDAYILPSLISEHRFALIPYDFLKEA